MSDPLSHPLLAMNPVTWRPLGVAVSLFAVMMAVVTLALREGDPPRKGELGEVPLREVVDLAIERDGYATLRGITFPVDELQGQLSDLAGTAGVPAVRVKVPRELDVEVLLKVMGLLKAAAVPQTTVDVQPEP